MLSAVGRRTVENGLLVCAPGLRSFSRRPYCPGGHGQGLVLSPTILLDCRGIDCQESPGFTVHDRDGKWVRLEQQAVAGMGCRQLVQAAIKDAQRHDADE